MMFETPTPPQTGGIYWNPQLGLISLSSDNETWITLADKNLGATKVSDGSRDSIWEGAGGHYYQWGNNHGFPFSGTFQTSSDKVDATNYGPYYYDNKLYTYYGREYPLNNNLNLRGGVTGTSLAMKGPCLEGYHIPTKDEMTSLDTIMGAIGATYGPAGTSGAYYYYLKMPYSGWLTEYVGQGEIRQRGTYGKYWTSTAEYYESQYYGTNLYFNQLWFYQNGHGVSLMSGGEGSNIRPFKNIPVSPDSTWTIIYDGSSHAENAGIFWNESLGLISLSDDGETRVTIADKNLGATQVRNYGDELTSENCGGYFERGNNYMFPFSGECETDTSITVDASNYGPYYNSDIYITGNNDENWSSSNNNNLWGGITDTLEARRGPCEEGFHIPLHLDFQAAIEVMANLGIDTSTGACMINYLKLPPAGYRNWRGELMLPSSPMSGNYRTSSTYDNDAWYLFFEGPYSVSIGTHAKVFGLCIRPFKNTPVVPDSTWTKLY